MMQDQHGRESTKLQYLVSSCYISSRWFSCRRHGLWLPEFQDASGKLPQTHDQTHLGINVWDTTLCWLEKGF